MNFKVATWNINSIRLREGQVCRFLEDYAPDVLCLQEIKSIEEQVPTKKFKELGYEYQIYRGQKSYNGVGIISRSPIQNQYHQDFCLKGDARHLVASLTNGITIENFYVPAGGDVPDANTNEKFSHKLKFLAEMKEKFIIDKPEKTILVGDLNIAPLENDVWSHKQLVNVVSHTEIEVQCLNAVLEAGCFVDVIRDFSPDGKLYTWWSYRSPNWILSDRGRRLDHIWASKDIASGLRESVIIKETRSWDRPSDHVPVVAEFVL